MQCRFLGRQPVLGKPRSLGGVSLTDGTMSVNLAPLLLSKLGTSRCRFTGCPWSTDDMIGKDLIIMVNVGPLQTSTL